MNFGLVQTYLDVEYMARIHASSRFGQRYGFNWCHCYTNRGLCVSPDVNKSLGKW